MCKCAIVIGVDKTGDLPVLQGAADGANQFASWAQNQGFTVKLLTDEDGSMVSLPDVKRAVREFVNERKYSQLVVFFSGHGILKGPGYELWLLSGAPDDADDAVNVTGSINLARNTGIKHIVIISDSCRSRADTSRLHQIEGGVIFPNQAPVTPMPVVDVFYATLPGDPALEVQSNEATRNYKGIFTDEMLNGLKGNVPEVIIENTATSDTIDKWVVPSWELKPYLERKVPEVAANINIRLNQDPDIRVESHSPRYLSAVAKPVSTPSRAPMAAAPSAPQRVAMRGAVDSVMTTHMLESTDPIAPSHDANEEAIRTEFVDAVERIESAKGRIHFETGTGFSIIGEDPTRAIVTRSGFDLEPENNQHIIRIYQNAGDFFPKTVLVQFANGCGTALAVLPGFIGTVLIEKERIASIKYNPSEGTDDFHEFSYDLDRLEKRRAVISVASRNGIFRVDSDKDASRVADYLRVEKKSDPTLGLYASYAYAQAGRMKSIQSVYKYMNHQPVPVLYDVALLAGKLPANDIFSDIPHTVAPLCPMLTQGWAYLDAFEDRIPKFVKELRRHLVPGLWTTFTPEGVDRLWAEIERINNT